MDKVDITVKNLFEGILFLLVVIVLFNSFSDFARNLGIVSLSLSVDQINTFGFISSFLASLNLLSNKFFGFSIIK